MAQQRPQGARHRSIFSLPVQECLAGTDVRRLRYWSRPLLLRCAHARRQWQLHNRIPVPAPGTPAFTFDSDGNFQTGVANRQGSYSGWWGNPGANQGFGVNDQGEPMFDTCYTWATPSPGLSVLERIGALCSRSGHRQPHQPESQHDPGCGAQCQMAGDRQSALQLRWTICRFEGRQLRHLDRDALLCQRRT